MKKIVFINVGGGPVIKEGGIGFTEGGLVHALSALTNLASDYDIMIVCPNLPESGRKQIINYDGVKIVCLESPKWVRWMNAGELSFTEAWWRTALHWPSILANYIEAYRYINKEKPEILIGNGILASFVLTLARRAPFKVGIIHHLYYALSVDGSHNHVVRVTGALERLFLRLMKLDKIGVVNPMVKDILVKRGICQDKIVVVGNGVNIDDYSFSENKARHSLIFIGSLRKLKRVESLIDVISIIKRRIPDVTLHIIGDGPNREEVNRKIAVLDVAANVVMHGYVSEKEKIDLLLSSAVYVSNSEFEGFGIPLVEAMATGTVPVVNDIAAHRLIFQGEDVGYLVSGVEEMAARLVELLANEPKRQQLARNGRKLVERRWTWRMVGEKYRELIEPL